MRSYAPYLAPRILFFALLGEYTSMGNPPEDLITHVPLIETGKPEPADNNYILYIPGGKTIPLQLR
jgi:hypothetical protein